MRHTIQAPPFLPPQGFPGLPMMPTAPGGPATPSGQGAFPGQGMPGMGMPGMGVPGMGMPGMGMPGMGMPNMAMPAFGGMGTPNAQGFPMAFGGAPQGMVGMLPISGVAPLGALPFQGPPQVIPTPPGGWPTMTAPPGGPLSGFSALQGVQPGGAQTRPFQGWTTGREES